MAPPFTMPLTRAACVTTSQMRPSLACASCCYMTWQWACSTCTPSSSSMEVSQQRPDASRGPQLLASEPEGVTAEDAAHLLRMAAELQAQLQAAHAAALGQRVHLQPPEPAVLPGAGAAQAPAQLGAKQASGRRGQARGVQQQGLKTHQSWHAIQRQTTGDSRGAPSRSATAGAVAGGELGGGGESGAAGAGGLLGGTLASYVSEVYELVGAGLEALGAAGALPSAQDAA